MAIYQPPTYSGTLAPTGLPQYGYPNDFNETSYFDLALTSSTVRALTPVANTATFYDAWCLDVTADISRDTTTILGLYSSYETAVLQSSAAFSGSALLSQYVSKLDNINWLLNFYTGQSPYTKGDVQVAIWNLLGQSGVDASPTALQNLYGYNQARADQLVNLALTTGEGYVPGLGQSIGIVMSTTQNNVSTQPIIIEVKSAALGDFVWEDKNANGIQDSGETGIAGVTVQLVREMDGISGFTGNEILSTTTTDGSGKYSFTGLTPGLDYQVLFTAPSGYFSTTKDAGSNDAIDSDGLLTPVVQLSPGENNTTLDSGFYKLAALGDRVWYDANNNGTQDTGEADAPGVKVHLFNAGGVEIATQTTDATGNYLFTGLIPGSYSVKFDAPTNYGFTTQDVGGNTPGTEAGDSDANTTGQTAAVTLTSGQTYRDLDAGLVATPPAHLGDFVWEDKNANGIQDSGEAGVAGVLVTLYNASGTAIGTTTTAANGLYGFDVLPGTYSVGFAPSSGFVFTTRDVSGNTLDATDSDADTTTGRTGQYTVGAGQSNLTIDAGIYKLAQLGDRVWYDANANGVQDGGELNAVGVTVSLLNAGGTVIATQVTNASGNYLFTNLVPGTYSVQFTAPTGYTFTTKDTAGNSNDVNDSDADTTTGKTGTYTLVSGESNITVDAGLIPIPVIKAHLGDRVWLDDNANGVQDTGEVGVANVLVNLKNSAGTVIASTTTNASGIYGFDVDPGTYSVQFVKPNSSYVLTTKDAGGNTVVSDAVDSDADTTTGNTGTYTLVGGDNNLTIDAGLYQLASIGDRIWYDKNANGIQDAGETNVAGVTLDLINNATNTIVGTQVTDANGNYLFTNLTPGSYHVDVRESTLPAGFIFTKANQGANDAVDSDVETLGNTVPLIWGIMANTTLTSGEVDRTWDAGVYKVGIDIEKYVSSTTCVTPVKGGTEGADCNYWKSACQYTTGGYWWAPTITYTGWSGITGCKASDSFNSVFGVNCTNGTKSIYDILCSTGTSAQDCAMRECVSAYLNACHDKVDYCFTKEQVCAQVQSCVSTASWSHTYNMFCNENVKGCDWSTSCTTSNCTVDTTLYDADAPPGLEVKTGSLVTFTYIVKNTGDTALQNVVVTDDRIANVTYVSGDTNNNGLLDLTETWTYKATETASAGTIKNTGTVVATDSVGKVAQVTDKDDAYYTGSGALKSSLGDRVWYDKDGDGIQDNGEVGVAGVKVTLKGAGADGIFGNADDITATTTTGVDGKYLFSNLAAGKYQVVFGDAAGYVLTKVNQGANDAVDSDADTTTRASQVITLGANEQNLTVDAGLIKPGIDVEKYVSGTTCTTTNVCGGEGASWSWWKNNCSSGTTWSVVSCKGTDTFGATFGVTCTNSTKTLYQILTSTSTASYDVWQRECVAAYLNAASNNCNYAYSRDQVCTDVKYALSCGDYTNCTTKLSYENNLGCTFTNPQNTYNCTVDTQLYDADAPPGLEVKTGSLVTFTYIVKNTGPVALKDVVLTDDRIASVQYVSGDTNNNGLLDTTETWTYKATETAAAGTIKNTGTVTAKDTTGQVTVTDKDDAYYTGSGSTKGSIGDRVFIDKDFDGVQESGEVGLGGIKVVLKGAGANGIFGDFDDITATTTTSSTGAYLFSNLDAGKYQLDFSDAISKGYLVTKSNIGNDAADSDIDSAGKTGVYTLGAGEQNLTVDAGVYQKACVGDKVWQDSNHNGLQDAGEAGIGGITVKLLSTSGTVLATTVTNSSGNYLFTNLDPGSYVLQFDKSNVIYLGINMNTWKWGVKNVGTNDAIDSDVAGDGVATTNVTKTDAFALVSGQTDLTRDATITPLVINLDGKGIHTTSLEDSKGTFDLLGNGTAIHSGWIASGSGFLAVDKNGNGSIDSVSELFGGNGKGAGFASLSAYDSNHDGVVNAADADFAKLLVWQDLNGDHASSADELMTLAQAGIASLSLAATDLQFADAQGNYHGEASFVTTTSGTTLGMTDVYFSVSAADAKAAGVALPTLADLLGMSTLDSMVGPAAPCSTTVMKPAAEQACEHSDGGEAMRRLAVLTREDCHAMG